MTANSDADARRRRGIVILAAMTVVAVAAVIAHGPIGDDPAYSTFADSRTLLGIANFWNVASNLPFVLVGALGIAVLIGAEPRGALPNLRAGYLVFFAGTVLVGIGSAFYHLHPDAGRLAWDRAPMTVAFMAFFSIVIGEYLDARLGARALVPLIVLGIASVTWWSATGDLRPYVLVQYLPMLLIPLILIWFPSSLTRPGYLWGLLGAYALAKLCEVLDRPSFELTSGVSGHALKHLVAGCGTALLLAAMTRRRQRAAASVTPSA